MSSEFIFYTRSEDDANFCSASTNQNNYNTPQGLCFRCPNSPAHNMHFMRNEWVFMLIFSHMYGPRSLTVMCINTRRLYLWIIMVRKVSRFHHFWFWLLTQFKIFHAYSWGICINLSLSGCWPGIINSKQVLEGKWSAYAPCVSRPIKGATVPL